MKSFTKVALLAATLSTVAVPCVSAMEIEAESYESGIPVLVAAVVVIPVCFVYRVYSLFFCVYKEAQEVNAVEVVDVVQADVIQLEQGAEDSTQDQETPIFKLCEKLS